MRIKYELLLWYNGILKLIPGMIGCKLRNLLLPYNQGKEVTIWDMVHIDSPSKLTIGDNVSINRGSIIHAGGKVTIGSDVLIGPNVTIYSQNHNYNTAEQLIREQGYNTMSVIIGDNVWIAANVTILPGVTISDNIVVGANSLVSKPLLESGVYVGSPAIFTKQLTN